MVAIQGLVGLRPDPQHIAAVTAPPYDVIKEGTPLEAKLRANEDSLYHVTLGEAPAAAIAQLKARGRLIEDATPCYYVYEQRFGEQTRRGVFAAVEVSDYSEHQIIRHEKTFDEKVKGRIALAQETQLNIGPVFLLTSGKLGEIFDRVSQAAPLYAFTSDFEPSSDLHQIANRLWRVEQASEEGAAIAAIIAPHPLYIADGHHRYHAALRGGQTHLLAYITEEAKITAYNRVVRGTISFAEARRTLALEPTSAFVTPPKHAFCLYSGGQSWLLRAQEVPDDVVGRLDCSILERELYPKLGLSHDQIVDPAHFDYYPESALDEMRAVVDAGKYELAIALHPVAIEELMAVADAGLSDPAIVMPEKSTFFAPKILSGIFLYRFTARR